jgi:hypothetical protein
MPVHEIARRLINGVWTTVDVEEGASSSSGIELLGPFSVTWQTPEIGASGALLTTLDQSQIILATYVFITETWIQSGGVFIYVGDPNISPVNLWIQSTDPGQADQSAPPTDGGIPLGLGLDISGATDGGIYVQCSNTVDAGALSVYLLVTPAT